MLNTLTFNENENEEKQEERRGNGHMCEIKASVVWVDIH